MSISPDHDEYRHIAPIYDFVLEPFLSSIRGEVCRVALSCRFNTILDLCCGTGRQAILLNDLGFDVTGVDLSPAMLQEARRKSKGSIRFFEEDASNLHFADGVFDCIILSFALHEKDIEIRNRIVLEAKRVAGRGGSVLIVDYMSPQGSISKAFSAAARIVERAAGAGHYAYYRNFMKNGALTDLLQHHGLQPILTRKYLFGTVGLVLTRPPKLSIDMPDMREKELSAEKTGA
jgi:demethylmenaquinone methyltransferase/2-methoxy-6-polyprenyl-1,4-benzoquinol methylase